jgi:glutamate dehydrogenase (NAD(P)+)
MGNLWPSTCDGIGPRTICLLRTPEEELEAFVVVDNVAAGPAIGGVRLAPDVSLEEVARLARAMTFKNAIAGLPHGGAKAGIVARTDLYVHDKEQIVRAFARAIRHLVDYIPGPDMGTDEASMAWVHDEIGRAVGLPRVLGGIPLDDVGATGYGLAVCAEAVATCGGPRVEGARVAIQGFGAVGRHAARFLHERGARVVAVSDSRGGTARDDGLDVGALAEWKRTGSSVHTFPGGRAVSGADVLATECELLIPAARCDALNEANAADVRAEVVLPGANIPATPVAVEILHDRGVLLVPDFVANAGGVICAAWEYRGATQVEAFAAIEERVRANTVEVLERARRQRRTPTATATTVASERVREAMAYQLEHSF